jgi:altronate dehydratase
LKRALAGYVKHPNFAHVVVVGLGCGITNLGDVIVGAPGDSLSIQRIGGTAAWEPSGPDDVFRELKGGAPGVL